MWFVDDAVGLGFACVAREGTGFLGGGALNNDVDCGGLAIAAVGALKTAEAIGFAVSGTFLNNDVGLGLDRTATTEGFLMIAVGITDLLVVCCCIV